MSDSNDIMLSVIERQIAAAVAAERERVAARCVDVLHEIAAMHTNEGHVLESSALLFAARRLMREFLQEPR